MFIALSLWPFGKPLVGTGGFSTLMRIGAERNLDGVAQPLRCHYLRPSSSIILMPGLRSFRLNSRSTCHEDQRTPETHGCPIALALEEVTGHKWSVAAADAADLETSEGYGLPSDAVAFIAAFDRRPNKYMRFYEPFSFELELEFSDES